MKIAIINITGGGMSGGYRKYLRNVIPRMSKHPDVSAILCASPASLNIKYWIEPLPNVKFVDCKPYRLFGYGNDSELNYKLKEFSPDVIFVPTERYFKFNGVPIVNMLQNMEPFVSGIDGNPFGERLKMLLLCIDAKRAIIKADRIIAVSNFVKDFLMTSWGIQSDRIGVVYHGIDMNQENNKVVRPNPIPNGCDNQFFFTAGSIRPARGIEDVLYAIKQLLDKSLDISGLIIAGETSPVMKKYRKRLEDWIKSQNLSSKIFWTGNLDESEMAWCYQNCYIFVMASRVESFGQIALEAMTHGCICVAADNPCLPEIFGDAAIYYPPKDYKALTEAIKTVFSWDSYHRKEASERARKRAAEFSWAVCAEKTVTELKKAVEMFRG